MLSPLSSMRLFGKGKMVQREINMELNQDNQVMDEDINCLMLHPIGWPNHGPQQELYLAEEAIGLVKSLSWTAVGGPGFDPASG